MLLLSRPPYLRWLAAGAVVIGALGWELSERSTEPFPFAAQDLRRGHLVEEDDVEWRRVPHGLLELPDLTGGRLAHSIEAGDPITTSDLTQADPLPEGWWSIPMSLPLGVARGSLVRLVLSNGPSVDGIVTIEAHEDSFGLRSAGAVAVAPDSADTVAGAVAAGTVTVLLEP